MTAKKASGSPHPAPLARKLRDLAGFTGTATLYELTPPLKGDGKAYRYVAVSATVALFSGPETYIFGANKSGEVTQWMELPGSYRGGLDHAEALRNAGYEVQP